MRNLLCKFALCLVAFASMSLSAFAKGEKLEVLADQSILSYEISFDNCFIENVPQRVFETYDKQWADCKKCVVPYFAYGFNQFVKNNANDLMVMLDNNRQLTIHINITHVDQYGNIFASISLKSKNNGVEYEHEKDVLGNAANKSDYLINIDPKLHTTPLMHHMSVATFNLGKEVYDILRQLKTGKK